MALQGRFSTADLKVGATGPPASCLRAYDRSGASSQSSGERHTRYLSNARSWPNSFGQPIVEPVEVLLVRVDVLAVSLPVDAHQLIEALAREVQAVPADVLVPRHPPERALDAAATAVHPIDDPVRARACSRRTRATGICPVSSRRNQFTRKMRGGSGICAAEVRASARSSRPCCSRRTAASPWDRAAWPAWPTAAAVASEPIVAARYTPCAQLNDWNTSGTLLALAPAEDERAHGHAARVLPLGIDRRALRSRRREARVGVRRGLGGRGRPVAAVPVDQVCGRIAHPFPPHVPFVGQGDVGEDAVRR